MITKREFKKMATVDTDTAYSVYVALAKSGADMDGYIKMRIREAVLDNNYTTLERFLLIRKVVHGKN